MTARQARELATARDKLSQVRSEALGVFAAAYALKVGIGFGLAHLSGLNSSSQPGSGMATSDGDDSFVKVSSVMRGAEPLGLLLCDLARLNHAVKPL